MQTDLFKLVGTIQTILRKYEKYAPGRNNFSFVLIAAAPKSSNAGPVFDWEKKEIRLYLNQPPAEVLAHAPYIICRELIKHTDPTDENPEIMVTRSRDLSQHVHKILQRGIDAVIQYYYNKRAIPLDGSAIGDIFFSITKDIQDLAVQDKIIHGLFSPYSVPKEAVWEWAKEKLRLTVSSAAGFEFDGKIHAWSLISYMAFLTTLARNAGKLNFEKECLKHLNGEFGADLMQIEMTQLEKLARTAGSLSPLLSARPEFVFDGYHIIFLICLEISDCMFKNMQVVI